MRRKRKNNVVLTGFMGSGKTSVGIRLSYCLRVPMEDTDKIIERRQERTINEIFASEGEEYFRRLETELLEELSGSMQNQILSVGGGTPLKEVNRKWLKRIGKVVYLRIRPETVYERLKGDDTRPLLKGEDPLGKITSLMEQRREAYEAAADIIVDVDDLEMEDVIDKIIGTLSKTRLRRKWYKNHRMEQGENKNSPS